MRVLTTYITIAVLVALTLASMPGAEAAEPTREWTAVYDGTLHEGDQSLAVAVDGDGNVYVTGDSAGAGTNYDIATVKYDTNGDQLWAARYNGPGNGRDRATSLAVDDEGNVYVGGSSYGAGTYNDIAIIKYDTNGNQLWVAIYDGGINDNDYGNQMKIAPSGHIIITGQSVGYGTYYDSVTIAYDGDGNQLWLDRYNGPVNGFDRASGIAFGPEGSIYVEGYCYGAGTGYDFLTIRYDPDGTRAWVRTYNVGGVYDFGWDVACDGAGNVYVTGQSIISGTDYDFVTLSYDPAGTLLWVSVYDEPGAGHDRAYYIDVGPSGQIYVTGESRGMSTNVDYATVAYAPDGSQLWVARYDGPVSSEDYPMALLVGPDETVYVTGYSYAGPEREYDCVTVAYDMHGTELWRDGYDGPNGGRDVGRAIAVDSSGHLVVTGHCTTPLKGYDYLTIRYSLTPDPQTSIEGLMASIGEMGLPQGAATSLLAKLEGAYAALERDQGDTAVNKLGAFINEVEAQAGKSLTTEQAEGLAAYAENIICLIQG